MAEPRSKRLAIVLTLAERAEQDAAHRLRQYREQINAEQEQLRQLDEYAEQYLKSYAERKSDLYAQELISYSSFIQRLGDARKDQQLKLDRMQQTLDQFQKIWREKHQKRKSIEELIERMQYEENEVLEKRLQKELDELAAQQFQRHS